MTNRAKMPAVDLRGVSTGAGSSRRECKALQAPCKAEKIESLTAK